MKKCHWSPCTSSSRILNFARNARSFAVKIDSSYFGTHLIFCEWTVDYLIKYPLSTRINEQCFTLIPKFGISKNISKDFKKEQGFTERLPFKLIKTSRCKNRTLQAKATYRNKQNALSSKLSDFLYTQIFWRIKRDKTGWPLEFQDDLLILTSKSLNT